MQKEELSGSRNRQAAETNGGQNEDQIWQRMAVGSSNGRSLKADLMATSLDIYRRADAPSFLDPVANDLVAVEKRQDK
jgi:hypothetical protein